MTSKHLSHKSRVISFMALFGILLYLLINHAFVVILQLACNINYLPIYLLVKAFYGPRIFAVTGPVFSMKGLVISVNWPLVFHPFSSHKYLCRKWRRKDKIMWPHRERNTHTRDNIKSITTATLCTHIMGTWWKLTMQVNNYWNILAWNIVAQQWLRMRRQKCMILATP